MSVNVDVNNQTYKFVTPINIIQFALDTVIDVSNFASTVQSTVHLVMIDIYTKRPGIDLIEFLTFKKYKKCICLCDIQIFQERIVKYAKNGKIFDLMHQNNESQFLFISNVMFDIKSNIKNDIEELATEFVVCNASLITTIQLEQMLRIAISKGYKDVIIIMHYEEKYVIQTIQHISKQLLTYFNTITFECNKSQLLQEMFPKFEYVKKSECVII